MESSKNFDDAFKLFCRKHHGHSTLEAADACRQGFRAGCDWQSKEGQAKDAVKQGTSVCAHGIPTDRACMDCREITTKETST